jgi:hypothetical protein
MTLSAFLTIFEIKHGGIHEIMIGGISRSIFEAHKGSNGLVGREYTLW